MQYYNVQPYNLKTAGQIICYVHASTAVLS